MTHEQIHDYLIRLGFKYSPVTRWYTYDKIIIILNNLYNNCYVNPVGTYPKQLSWPELKAKLDEMFKEEKFSPCTHDFEIISEPRMVNIPFTPGTAYSSIKKCKICGDIVLNLDYDLLKFEKETTMQQPTWEIFDEKGNKIGIYYLHRIVEIQGKSISGFSDMHENGKYKDFTILCSDQSIYKAKLVKPAEPKFKVGDCVEVYNAIGIIEKINYDWSMPYLIKLTNRSLRHSSVNDLKLIESLESWANEHLPKGWKLYRATDKDPKLSKRVYTISAPYWQDMGHIDTAWPLDKQIAIAQAYIDAVASEGSNMIIFDYAIPCKSMTIHKTDDGINISILNQDNDFVDNYCVIDLPLEGVKALIKTLESETK